MYATTTRTFFTKLSDAGNKIMQVASMSNPDIKYTVDVTNGRCSCPAWKFQKGQRVPCKHLRKLGFVAVQREPVREIQAVLEFA